MKAKCLAIILVVFVMATSAGQACEYPNDPHFQKECEECAGKTGYQWNFSANRCLVTAHTKQVREGHKECGKLEGKAKHACFQQQATIYSGVNQGEAERALNKAEGSSGPTLSLLYAAMTGFSIMLGKKSGKESFCLSKAAAIAGGATHFGIHLYSKNNVEKKLRKKAAEFRNLPDEENYDMQVKALEYLKAEQDEIVKYGKIRKKGYMAVGIMYAASAGLAAFETMNMGNPTPPIPVCRGKKPKKEGEADPNDPNAEGDQAQGGESEGGKTESSCSGGSCGGESGSNTDSATGKAGPGGLLKSVLSFGSSPMILAASGVAAGMTVPLYKGAKDQIARSRQNSADVAQAIEGFKNSMANFCKSRDDVRNAKCYCYSDDGKPNPNRTKSVTCQALWKKDSENFHLGATDYSTEDAPTRQGCFLLTGEFDLECKCKKFKDKKSKLDACMHIQGPTSQIANNLPNLGAPQATSLFNNIAENGVSSIASLSGSKLNKQAARNRKRMQEAIDKLNETSGTNFKLPTDAQAAILADRLIKKNPSFQKFADSDILGGENLIGAELKKKKALAKVLEDPKLKKVKYLYGKSKMPKGKKATLPSFDFSNPVNAAKTVSFENSNPEFEYQGTDITQKKDESIWIIISRRYMISGVKRLMDD